MPLSARQKKEKHMKKIISIFMIIVTLMTVVCFATTIEPRTAETPMLINETVDMQENKNIGDSFVLEDKDHKISNQTINGNEFVMVSKKCTLEDTIINGNLFIFATEIEIKNTTITGSVFALSKEIEIENSNISDLYALAPEVSLKENTVINREAKILGQNVTINAVINGNSYIHGEKVEIKDKAVLNGNNQIQYTSEYIISDNAIAEKIETNQIKQDVESIKKQNIESKLSEWIKVLIKTAIIIGIIFMFGFKKFNTFIVNDENRKSMFKISLIGAISLVAIPTIAFTAILVSFGLLFGISFILLGIYVILIYISEAIVAFAIALIISEEYMEKETKFGLFVITLIIASLLWGLTNFPVIGNLVNFVVLLLGFGIIVEYIFKAKKIKNEEEIIIEPEVK